MSFETTSPARKTRCLRSAPTQLAVLALALVTSAAYAQSLPPSFSKSFNPGTIGPGSVSTLSFEIDNTGSTPFRNLAFSDPLPSGVTIATPAHVINSCGGSLSAPDGGATIALSGGEIGASSTCSVSVDVTSTTPGAHTNVSGDLTSDGGNSGSATATLTVATDRPGFHKSFSPGSVLFGGRSTLTLTIDNTANSSQMFNLSFVDTLPAGMVIASPTNAAKTCTGGTLSAPAGGSAISYSAFPTSTVAAGSSCTISVDVIGNAVGKLGNVTGELTSTPGGPSVSSGKASAVLNVTVQRIALIKSFTDDPVPPGGTVTLELTVLNLDRSSDATNIAFTDDLDAALSGLTAVGLPLVDPCGAGSQLSGTSVLSLTGGSLPAEGSCTFSVTLQVPAGAAPGSYLNTTSDITADIGGRPQTGDPASDTLFVQAAPLLTKSFVDDPVGGGGSVTLEFTITNTSPDQTATDIAFSDELDVVLPTASAVPSSGFCGAGATATFTPLINPSGSGATPARLTVSGASLAPGDSCTFSITLDVVVGAPGGFYPNTTSDITASINGETVSGNPASDDLQIVAAPELHKEFTDDPVAPGDTVTLQFTLSHDENAVADATGIAFTDDLDATLSGLVAVGLPASDVCGLGSQLTGTSTLSLTGGTLAPGDTCTFSVTLQVPTTATAGPHANTTSAVVATVSGVETTGNAASDDLSIAGLTLTKEFIDDPVIPGGTVTLRFTIQNDSPSSAATDIFFRDDLRGVLANLAATVLPGADPCGVGSSLTAASANRLLTFQGGSLAAGDSCSFDVVLQVPAGTMANTYTNLTQSFSADIDGSVVFFDNAADVLTVSDDLLTLTKEFVDDPVSPGETVTLRFTLTNLDATETIADIAFTDDLDAALSGLANAGGTLTDICGVGSQLAGTSTLSLTGGSLAPGGSCTFDVTLDVPLSAPLGSVSTNTTGEVTGTAGGLPVRGEPASDDLRIDALSFSKSFAGTATAGGTVTLSFTIQNLSATDSFDRLEFTDDLGAMLAGLTATGLPSSDLCGEGSMLSGASSLTFVGGSLLPGGSCTFSVVLQVPASAAAGSYLNTTSELVQEATTLAPPATATLTVEAVVDADGDGVLDGDDVCPGTVIPEGVPTQLLRPNHYALVDADTIFDTVTPPGGGPGDVFTTTDTAGCSCEQIIDALHLGKGHRKFGCSVGVMRNWVSMVSSASSFAEIVGRPYGEDETLGARRLGGGGK